MTIKTFGLKFVYQISPTPVSSGFLSSRIRYCKIQLPCVVHPRSKLSLPSINASCISSYIKQLAVTFSTPKHFKRERKIIIDIHNWMFYITEYEFKMHNYICSNIFTFLFFFLQNLIFEWVIHVWHYRCLVLLCQHKVQLITY